MNPLPDYQEALRLALTTCSRRPPAKPQEVKLADALDRRLAKPVLADRDIPPFDRAMMDGYALRASDVVAGRAFAVVGEIAAGTAASSRVPAGACVKIATGAPLPVDCNAVVPHESSDRANPVRFVVPSVQAGAAVHPRAADAKAGTPLIATGTRLRPHHIGIAAAVGAGTLFVHARPRACIITSGDEVRPSDTPISDLALHQIRNTNGPMLHALLQRLGAEVVSTQHVPDEADATIAAVRRAIDEAELIITVGGVSAGERDHFPTAFDACSIKRALNGAAIQPGRPVVVGIAPNNAIVNALPGNPVSALACACLFTWPMVLMMQGVHAQLPWREIDLGAPVRPNPHRRAFRPAIVRPDGRAIVPRWAGSGDLVHTGPTDGLLELPADSAEAPQGARLRFLRWP